ncbi:MAG: sulfite exporter TauE/SafE family protein [Bacteroidia bacterium]|nr:sulfite exporter TauE/SafE family protein [Bacteroidia bacterium]
MIWTALILGLAGSLHCIGMCGPLALALPFRTRWHSGKFTYQLGRIVTYSLLGAVAGLFGQMTALAGIQQGLSIGLGILVLVLAIGAARLESGWVRIPLVDRSLARLRKQLGALLGHPTPESAFNFGLLNGLLPCGLVYSALAGAAATGEVAQAMAFMALFGLGTAPALAAVLLGSTSLRPLMARYARPLITSVAILFAALLILRGLNLGIPYLSPALEASAGTAECH